MTAEGEGQTLEPDPLQRIRDGSAAVMARGRWVRLDPAALERLAGCWSREPPPTPRYDPRFHHRGAAHSTLAFVLTLASLNFGSGYFPHLRKHPGLSGYFTVARGLKQRFDDRGPWSAVELAEIDPAQLALVLGQEPPREPVVELLGLFARALHDLGQLLLARYEGRFEGLVEEADGSAARLVGGLARMPFFRDVAIYETREVPFYKRAQLAAADLALAFDGRGHGAFRDLSGLTAFADNLVPHVLRRHGVLVYEPSLADRIEAGEEIPSGSAPEVEIRAGAVHGVECLVAALARRGYRVTAHAVDHTLWHAGQDPEMKAHPRHRTRCVYY